MYGIIKKENRHFTFRTIVSFFVDNPIPRLYLYRIQQIQLLASNTPAEMKERLWTQIEAEMCLQRAKTIAQICKTKQVTTCYLLKKIILVVFLLAFFEEVKLRNWKIETEKKFHIFISLDAAGKKSNTTGKAWFQETFHLKATVFTFVWVKTTKTSKHFLLLILCSKDSTELNSFSDGKTTLSSTSVII